MYMKKSIFLSFLLSSCLFVTAQSLDLQKLSEKKRNKHLVETAKEVVMAFAPKHYREYKRPIILGPYDYDPSQFGFEGKEKFVGRQFYVVIIQYDFRKETLNNDFAAKVGIWADDGTPMTIESGSQNLIIHFLCTSFEQYKKDGIPESLKLPYFEFHSRWAGAPTFRYDPNEKRSWEEFDEEYKKNKENEKK